MTLRISETDKNLSPLPGGEGQGEGQTDSSSPRFATAQDHNAYANQELASERAETLRDEEWQLHNECITLAREALELYKAQGEKHLRIPDITRLLDLASRLGRLATGTPTEHIEHAWSEYQNRIWTTQFEADLKRIYGNSEDQPRSADFSRDGGTVSQASSLPQ